MSRRAYTVSEAADLLGRSPHTIRTWLRDGVLRGIHPPGAAWIIPADALGDFAELDGRQPPTIVPPAVLYRLFDSDGALLYVGITTKGLLRWASHAHFAEWWPTVASATIAHYPTLGEAAAAEEAAIRTEKPRYNVIFTAPRYEPRASRGKNGSGTVFQRGRDQRWVATVSHRGRRTSRSFATREEAEEGRAELLRSIR